jgi:hypothetical protein
MAEEKKSFSDLLSEAPLAPAEDTVTLVGALARSSQSGKFVLALSQGGSITLDVDAVKSYQVMGGAVGQQLVQVDVDKTKVPETAQPAFQPIRGAQSGLPDVKHPALEKNPWEEPVRFHPDAVQAAANPALTKFTGIYDYKHPSLDKYPWEEPVKTHPETDTAFAAPASLGFTGIHDVKHPSLDKYPWEEPVRTHPETDAPFALATPQQAPEAALTAMQGAASSALRTIQTYDVTTGWRDYKHPILDATGRPPYLD